MISSNRGRCRLPFYAVGTAPHAVCSGEQKSCRYGPVNIDDILERIETHRIRIAVGVQPKALQIFSPVSVVAPQSLSLRLIVLPDVLVAKRLRVMRIAA